MKPERFILYFCRKDNVLTFNNLIKIVISTNNIRELLYAWEKHLKFMIVLSTAAIR
jgi:hypothetical protein